MRVVDTHITAFSWLQVVEYAGLSYPFVKSTYNLFSTHEYNFLKKKRKHSQSSPASPLPFSLTHLCSWITVRTGLGLDVMWSFSGLALVGGPSRKSLIFLSWNCSSRYVWIYRKCLKLSSIISCLFYFYLFFFYLAFFLDPNQIQIKAALKHPWIWHRGKCVYPCLYIIFCSHTKGVGRQNVVRCYFIACFMLISNFFSLTFCLTQLILLNCSHT